MKISLSSSNGATRTLQADFNGDGMSDILFYSTATGMLKVGLGDGTGRFTYVRTASIGPGYSIERGDFNHDAELLGVSACEPSLGTRHVPRPKIIQAGFSISFFGGKLDSSRARTGQSTSEATVGAMPGIDPIKPHESLRALWATQYCECDSTTGKRQQPQPSTDEPSRRTPS